MNRPTLPALNVHWLTDPTATGEPPSVPESHDLQRVQFPIPPDIGQAWMERLPLAEGVSLFRGIHRFRLEARGQRVPLGEFSYRFPETTFCAQVMDGGTAHHRELYPPAELNFQPGHDFFRLADRFHTISSIDSPADSDMTALMVTETVLTQLMDEEVAKQLLVWIGLDSPPAVKVLPIPRSVSAPLRAAFSTQLQGSLQRLFAQSKILEYLCALCAYTTAGDPQAPRLADRRDQLRELHDYLTQLEGRLPGLEDLAVQFRMSARRLNAAFAEQYGLPIYAFIADRRLNEAYAAIRDSEVALKVLADRLGYSHVNHFSRAFRRKFGHPPGQLRCRRGAAQSGAENEGGAK
ncbi:helix-turn-helix transcriptional regulator [Thiocapsa marina]|uniref:Transcriptional regulator, AraC family n=1 Tax=Thiocapsa marina 5811 TaxID=768671 RepID=F9UDH7_9GAMM|nr:AraC family transcriptional regulator [Thiocapsa marina]EGV17921.1 transcriptional regulator, AraC family [Thiocapsa marina 5811]